QMQYRSLRIPCCSICNQEDLSRLETTISSAVASGYDACAALPERLLYLWAGKLYYGILRKETTLLQDRARPRDGNIIGADVLQSFSELHLFLQGIRGRHEFSSDVPYSVLVCNLHDVGQPRNYCFRDSLHHMVVALRLGEVGFIVALEDAGLTRSSYGRYVSAVAGRKLHPIQFEELCVKVLYQISLLEGGVTYITSKSQSKERPIRTDVLGGGSLRPRSQEEFSRVLRPFVEDWLRAKGEGAQWFVPPNLVPTWMSDPSGELLFRSIFEWESGAALDA
ncbi:MAG TPA: hypothetical protein VGO85_13355, partial [Caldimonas sp.]|nr:hypothetical protein [Caldimonas sp.]